MISINLILIGLVLVLIILVVYILFMTFRYSELNQQIKKLDKQKSEFISIASHQLRSPVSVIQGYVSMILEGDYGKTPEKIKEPLQRSLRSSKALVMLIDDYLDTSQISRGEMEYVIENFDLSELLKDLVSEFKLVAEKNRLDFINQIPQNKIMIKADKNKMKQIISNIIDNAIKYTPNGFIKISTEINKNKVIIKITDSGIGIEPEKTNEIFNKFARSNEAIKMNVVGTGLGLFVAKTMIEAQDGNIWVESGGENMGSTFFISIPIAKEI